VNKRNGGVNEERISGGCGFGEEADKGVRSLVEEGTGDDVEKFGAVTDKYLETNGEKPQNES
jgi:hypothetical protein